MKAFGLFLVLLLIAAGALAFRLPRLKQRPMHVDEAVQAFKFGELHDKWYYRYDPKEFHGPTLNYVTLPLAYLGTAEGRSYAQTDEFTYRIVPVIFGVATVVLLVLLAEGLGWGAVFVAAVLTAISPAMVFYSRYYIHETLLVCFTLGFIGAAWQYTRAKHRRWALLAGAFLALMFATKETFVIALIAMAIGCFCTSAWDRWVSGDEAAWHKMAHLLPDWKALLGAVVVACVISGVLFSSFFTNAQGPLDAIQTFTTYAQRAGQELHRHPWDFYLRRLFFFRDDSGPLWSEGLIGFLALAGFVAALIGKGIPAERRSLARFLGFYTVALITGYSMIGYKTPWCALSFLHGMILLAGVGAVVLLKAMPNTATKAIAAILLVAAAGHLGWQAYRASYKYYADPRNPWVYAHTGTDMANFERRVEELARVHPDGHDMLVKVVTRDYWPVPWYMRRFSRLGYWHEPPEDSDAPLIVSAPDVEAALGRALKGKYHKEYFGSRPEVFLQLYVDAGLWDEFVKSRSAPAAAPKSAPPAQNKPGETKNARPVIEP
ncbi:MAG: TIGR03663 family protein [Planctomycetota bacterium]|nr:TIGR03663 family protein [Planctomycetota bacterium]